MVHVLLKEIITCIQIVFEKNKILYYVCKLAGLQTTLFIACMASEDY